MTKKLIDRHNFECDDDISSAEDIFLKVRDTDFYMKGICMLHNIWTVGVNVEDFLKRTSSMSGHELIFNHPSYWNSIPALSVITVYTVI